METRAAILDPTSDEIEAFEQHRLAQNLVALRTGILITLLIQVPFIFYEWVAIADHFWTLQLLRIVFIGTTIALGLTINSSVSLQRHVDLVTFGIFAICAAFIIAAAFFDKGYASPYSYVLVMMLVGVGFVTLWPWDACCVVQSDGVRDVLDSHPDRHGRHRGHARLRRLPTFHLRYDLGHHRVAAASAASRTKARSTASISLKWRRLRSS